LVLGHAGLVEVRPCPHGRGLFASKDIEMDRVIRAFDALVVVPFPSSPPGGGYALRVGEREYWDAFPRRSPDYWSNFIDHADDPNAVFVFERDKKRARFLAAKPIRKGEEIFINYRDYYFANPVFND
jgi:hypothetical protein